MHDCISRVEHPDYQKQQSDSHHCLCFPVIVRYNHLAVDPLVFVLISLSSMIIPLAFRLATFPSPSALGTDGTFSLTNFLIWTQTAMNYALISATVPSLRPFVNNLVTHYGGSGQAKSGSGGYGSGGYAHGSGDHKGGHSASAMGFNGSLGTAAGPSGPGYQMNTIKSQLRSKNRDPGYAAEDAIETQHARRGQPDYVLPRPDLVSGPTTQSNAFHVQKEKGDAGSVGSDDSQRLIIRKDTTWVIER